MELVLFAVVEQDRSSEVTTVLALQTLVPKIDFDGDGSAHREA